MNPTNVVATHPQWRRLAQTVAQALPSATETLVALGSVYGVVVTDGHFLPGPFGHYESSLGSRFLARRDFDLVAERSAHD